FEVVRRRIADRRIEAAFAMACGEHVPDADAVRQHPFEPRVISELMQRRLPEHVAEQSPELIARMRVVLRGVQRRFTWKTAEDHRMGGRPDDRRKAPQHHTAPDGRAPSPYASTCRHSAGSMHSVTISGAPCRWNTERRAANACGARAPPSAWLASAYSGWPAI